MKQTNIYNLVEALVREINSVAELHFILGLIASRVRHKFETYPHRINKEDDIRMYHKNLTNLVVLIAGAIDSISSAVTDES